MHPNFHLSYGILVRKYKNVTITLQKERENPLQISFCFQTGDKIVIYVSTHGHWDCTTFQHHYATFGFASGYTEVLQGSTISMPTGRHVDNLCLPYTYILLLTLYNILLLLTLTKQYQRTGDNLILTFKAVRNNSYYCQPHRWCIGLCARLR
jgi:hypothetical protein